MNKVLSQAIKKAVSEYTTSNVVNIDDNSQKRPEVLQNGSKRSQKKGVKSFKKDGVKRESNRSPYGV